MRFLDGVGGGFFFKGVGQVGRAVVDVLVILQRHAPDVQVVHILEGASDSVHRQSWTLLCSSGAKTVEIPQVQFSSWTRLLSCPLWALMVQTVQKPVEIPQVQFSDKVAVMPVVGSHSPVSAEARGDPQVHGSTFL